jgi:phospholipid-translocating ATPase
MRVRADKAIGHSTNLIGRDSNIIVIRGGGSRPVYQQMVHAIEEFFPGNGVPAGLPKEAPPRRSTSSDPFGPPNLNRADTGVSSIVGPDNGDRPGGFVLVIEGVALGVVCLPHSVVLSLAR